MEIKVSKCSDCPFCYVRYDEYSMGDEVTVICNILYQMNLKGISDVDYEVDSHTDLSYNIDDADLPDVCPLIKEDYSVKLSKE